MARSARPRPARVGRITVGRYHPAAERRGHRDRLAIRLLPALVAALVVAGVAYARLAPPETVTVGVTEVTGGAPNGTPGELKAAAADLLAATTAKGGTGYRFEIVQRSTFVEKAGGPRIDADDAYLIGLVETGYVLPSGFYMEMRSGPGTAEADASLTDGELMYRTLVKGGTTYRDDGDGWYPTDLPPGVGLDPVTAAALPGLLRHTKAPKDADLTAAEGELGKAETAAARAITAEGEVVDIPGVVAADGKAFTEITDPMAFTFDDAGRLVGITVTARNTNVTDYDLVVVTEIRLRYDDVPTGLPKPEPAYAGPQQLVTE